MALDGDVFADTEHCLNCSGPLNGVFCAACGQKRVHRLTFRSVFGEAVKAVVKVDSGFIRTLFGLTLRPGKMVREYVEGRRKTYINPIKYTLFTTTLFLLLINVFDLEVWRLTAQFDESGREGFMLIFGLLTYLVFVNVLGPAVVQRIAFRKHNRNLSELYVLALFCYGHLVLFFIVAAFLGGYNSPSNYLSVVAGSVLYLAWAVMGFYQTHPWWAFLTALFMVIAYYVLGSLMSWVIRFAFYFLR